MKDILTIEIADSAVIHCPIDGCVSMQVMIDDDPVVIYVIL